MDLHYILSLAVGNQMQLSRCNPDTIDDLLSYFERTVENN